MIYEFVSSSRYTDTSTAIHFKLNGRRSIVVRPDHPLPGNPTVWRTEFFTAFDFVDKALLAKGWHLCYHSASNMYGCPESLVMLREFYTFAEQTFGLNPKPVLFGFSRGGLYAVNYAHQYPDAVGALYLDAPVLDIKNWPCCVPTCREAKECLDWYRLTWETLPDFKEIPLNRAEEMAEKGIPVVIVAGGADKTVVWEQNGEPFARRMRAAGGDIRVIVKPECDHHPHSITDVTPVTEFIEARCL